jgi:hypothetical protein
MVFLVASIIFIIPMIIMLIESTHNGYDGSTLSRLLED